MRGYEATLLCRVLLFPDSSPGTFTSTFASVTEPGHLSSVFLRYLPREDSSTITFVS